MSHGREGAIVALRVLPLADPPNRVALTVPPTVHSRGWEGIKRLSLTRHQPVRWLYGSGRELEESPAGMQSSNPLIPAGQATRTMTDRTGREQDDRQSLREPGGPPGRARHKDRGRSRESGRNRGSVLPPSSVLGPPFLPRGQLVQNRIGRPTARMAGLIWDGLVLPIGSLIDGKVLRIWLVRDNRLRQQARRAAAPRMTVA